MLLEYPDDLLLVNRPLFTAGCYSDQLSSTSRNLNYRLLSSLRAGQFPNISFIYTSDKCYLNILLDKLIWRSLNLLRRSYLDNAALQLHRKDQIEPA